MFYNRGERGKDNETGVLEGGGIEMYITVLHNNILLFRFCIYLLLWLLLVFVSLERECS